ncbi:MAG: PilZ domain-containing protein [Myxococcaceae bacterium]|nr:PilZ domain-containing protein [Myxococcaceae bacterium]
MSKNPQEKRASPRVRVSLTAHCRIGNRFVRDPIADLSTGGLYLKTKEPAREGLPVRVALALPDKDGPRFLTLVGNVARLDRDEKGRLLGIGVSFSAEEIGSRDREALERFLASAA